MHEQQTIKNTTAVVYKEGMDQWLLVVTSDPAANGLAKDMEVASAGPVHCHFFLPPLSLACVVPNIVSEYKLIALLHTQSYNRHQPQIDIIHVRVQGLHR